MLHNASLVGLLLVVQTAMKMCNFYDTANFEPEFGCA